VNFVPFCGYSPVQFQNFLGGYVVVRRWFIGGLAIGISVLIGSPLGGQNQRPLSPLSPGGLRVAPFFDGWYANQDGTITLSFGYSNLNRELVEIPLGPDNFIEPKQYDGRQPTSFPPPAPAEDGASARNDRRERGVFTVSVPAGFGDSVVWTLHLNGQTYKVPGTAKSGAYQLRWPMAMGSVPPLLRFSPEGPAGRGPTGIHADPKQISVGMPLSLAIWMNDDSVREADPVAIKPRQERPAVNVTWLKHSGPGPVVFSRSKESFTLLNGTATASATFKQPGEYVIRVRVDNFGRLDTSPGNQCCWTNGYVRVNVTP
jgi:hypothetical protein